MRSPLSRKSPCLLLDVCVRARHKATANPPRRSMQSERGWVDRHRGRGYSRRMGLSTPRTLRFRLSKALAENQHWAVTSFPAIVQRATGHSERWAFVDHATDPDGLHEWRYEVQGFRRWTSSWIISFTNSRIACCSMNGTASRRI